MATYKNDRSGESIESPLTDAQAAEAFEQQFGGKQHWIWFWIHKAVLERKQPTAEKSMALLQALFILAVGMGLKRPQVRLHWRTQRFKLYLSQRGTLCLKTGRLATQFVSLETGEVVHSPTQEDVEACKVVEIGTHDPVGDEQYIGCILRGNFLPVKGEAHTLRGQVRQPNEVEADFLARLEADPDGFMAQCSKDMGRCCYCYQPLEDPRSKEVGYGETCSKRWGLPWGGGRRGEAAPSFAKAWDRTANGLCQHILQDPKDEARWYIFADWLEEQGLPRVKPPEAGVVLPRLD